MLFDWQVAFWRQRFERATFPQSMLVSGSPGGGVLEFARSIAESILCASPAEDGQACGHCRDCEWSQNGRHPDFLGVGAARSDDPADDDEDGVRRKSDSSSDHARLKVGEIRTMTDFLLVAPNRDRARVAFLYPAEDMNLSAANALLKILEEPPARAHLILVTHAPARLAATIRSRCIHLKVPAADRQQAVAWLVAQGVNRPDLALAQVGYAPLAARDLSADYWAVRSRLLPVLGACARKDQTGELISLAESVERQVAVRLLQTWCADMLSSRTNPGSIRFHPDCSQAIRECAAAVPPRRLFELELQLRASRRWVDHPMNSKLANEELFLAYNAMFRRI